MKDLINFFFSFDKLMKHKLVPMFFWAALIFLAIVFTRDILGFSFITNWIAKLTGWLEIIAMAVMAFVGLRLVCELAIAVFRISDNLSADGGASDLADIDPLEETRRAAEEAAKRAREVTGKAVDKTKSAASNLKDSAEKRFDKTAETTPKPSTKTVDTDQVFDKPVSEPTPKVDPKPVTKPATKKKTTAKKPAAKKATTAKKTTTANKKTTAKKKSTAKTSTTKKKSD